VEAPSNAWIAERLEETAELLEAQRANPFRIRAYRAAAATVRGLGRPAADLVARAGREGLRELSGIGVSLARAIEELVRAGRYGFLERLRGEAAPEEALTSVAGIGPELAHRIHEELGIESVYDLEAAAHDGRLRRVAGMGPRRVRAVKESLAGRFRRPPRTAWRLGGDRGAAEDAPVAEILDVDREYRAAAEAGRLPRIAPLRFNPRRERWLPVLHTERGVRHFTALWSNTALAHQVGATREWVVIYRDDEDGDGRWTVVTAQRGPLAGRRVVRGREAECLRFGGAQP
jgi:predicted flap endonuclease-1-like 5' DNA nuclease